MLILLAVICSLSSCVKEELIGPSEKEGLPVTIGVSMSALEATTKADTKSSATDDEATINDGFILVFKKADVGADPNECIGYAKVESSDDIKGEGVTVNTITGHVRFVGIANADENLSQKLVTAFAGTTKGDYAALKAMTSSQLLDDPTKLIKVGTKDEELKLPPTNEKIEIEVAHLAARVDFTVKSVSDGWTIKIKDGTTPVISKVCVASDVLLGKYAATNYSYNSQSKISTASEIWLNENRDSFTFYTYEKNSAIEISMDVTFTRDGKSIEKTITASLTPKADKAGSVTNGFVHGYRYIVTGNVTPAQTDIELLIKMIPWTVKKVNVDYGKPEWDNDPIR